MLDKRLLEIAEKELESVKSWIAELEFPMHAAILVEACRVLDCWNVQEIFSKNGQSALSRPDFDIISRGWNSALALLLPHVGKLSGFPLRESNDDTFNQAMSLLHQLGRVVTLRQSADMIHHGLATGEIRGEAIILQMSERVGVDYYLDRLDAYKLQKIEKEMPGEDAIETFLDSNRENGIQKKMEELVFPWETGCGTMIGYGAEPEIDDYFIALVTKSTIDWRNEAGIHPGSRIGDVSGGDLRHCHINSLALGQCADVAL
jgi:hypothetical protein